MLKLIKFQRDLYLLKNLLLSFLVCISASANDNNESSTFSTDFTKTEKVLLTNVAIGSIIVGWGVSQWGYGDEDFHTDKEGWFGKDTSNGGSDKLGHFYTNYLITRILSPLYENWGYSNKDAAFYASLSTVFFSGLLMEVGDGFSEHGFSKEDLLVDILGAATGYLLATQPSLAEKIDFRVEYNPFLDTNNVTDFTTDYERMKYLKTTTCVM